MRGGRVPNQLKYTYTHYVCMCEFDTVSKNEDTYSSAQQLLVTSTSSHDAYHSQYLTTMNDKVLRL